MKEIVARHLFAAQATLGEGPIWDPRTHAFWWIDIVEKKLFQFELTTKSNRYWQLDQMPGTVVVAGDGNLVLALQNGFYLFDTKTAEMTSLGDPEADKPDNRFNDGKCDPGGRFWAGTMRIDNHMEEFTGSLYSLDCDRKITRHLGDEVGVSNGIAWNQSATKMYWADSPRRKIYQFDYDLDSGTILNQSTLFHAPDEIGFPDGMAIDSEDKLWVAFWDGGCVARICPETSSVLEKITVPISAPTACALGGPNLNQLFITTASEGMINEGQRKHALAGDLFIANVDVPGLPQPEWGESK